MIHLYPRSIFADIPRQMLVSIILKIVAEIQRSMIFNSLMCDNVGVHSVGVMDMFEPIISVD